MPSWTLGDIGRVHRLITEGGTCCPVRDAGEQRGLEGRLTEARPRLGDQPFEDAVGVGFEQGGGLTEDRGTLVVGVGRPLRLRAYGGDDGHVHVGGGAW